MELLLFERYPVDREVDCKQIGTDCIQSHTFAISVSSSVVCVCMCDRLMVASSDQKNQKGREIRSRAFCAACLLPACLLQSASLPPSLPSTREERDLQTGMHIKIQSGAWENEHREKRRFGSNRRHSAGSYSILCLVGTRHWGGRGLEGERVREAGQVAG